MSIVDEKGRLFGKLNLLDLVVVLAVLAVAGRFGYRYYRGRHVTAVSQDKPIEVTFKLQAVSDPTIKVLQPGTEIYDAKSNAFIGKVKAIRQEPAVITGAAQEFLSKYTFDVFVTVAGPGRISPNGVTMADVEMKIGNVNFLKTAMWKGQGPTWAINPEPAR